MALSFSVDSISNNTTDDKQIILLVENTTDRSLLAYNNKQDGKYYDDSKTSWDFIKWSPSDEDYVSQCFGELYRINRNLGLDIIFREENI